MMKAFVDLLKDEEIRQTLGKDPEELNARPMDPPTEEETEKLSTLGPNGSRKELPPFREINHQIPLIDPDKQYRYHLPRCPDAKKPELLEKIARYTKLVAKKNGKLRTVVDTQDVMPFPDQDQIRMDVARAKYRSKIDLSDAYEQIRIIAEDYDITYMEGTKNKVADCLSRYYENDNADDYMPIQDIANADVRLDPEWDDLPQNCVLELRAGHIISSQPLPQLQEARDLEAAEMAAAVHEERAVNTAGNNNPTLGESLANGPPLRPWMEKSMDFDKVVKGGYSKDPLFQKVLESPTQFTTFVVRDGMIYTKSRQDDEVLCIPHIKYECRQLPEFIIDQGHMAIGHFGAQKTSKYIRHWFWWPKIGRDVERFCATCGTCQMAKPCNHPMSGLLHTLPIPRFPWNSVAMDFVGPFPKSQGYDYLWVVVCRLTSMVHLVPMNTTSTASDIAERYLREIVRLHGLPESIVSDHDSKFTSKFWRELHRLMGTKLLMSTSFHLQTDGLSEWTISNTMMEFALNSSASATTGFAPFELNYGYLSRMISGMHINTNFAGMREFAQRALANLAMVHDMIIEAHVNQAYQANKHRQAEPEFQVSALVYLSTQNLALPKGRVRKLMPKYISPYKILSANAEKSTYTLELLKELQEQCIHPTFHVSLLRQHEPNDEMLFPHREAQSYYDFGVAKETEWLVDEIVGHHWDGRKVEFHIRWTLDWRALPKKKA
ncbi:Transposon Ty3-G Gag-Pol polyprotein [Grifola frondosa]|uniref:Transposon Ty3-G Gag-Pol polyprotein n=1 Tax=Grifola frondosa TaxID=5627 RepID=A0A1C7MJB0_GRIFR|nr:Transposon Ty3-G Gag-Pol polyprotein [Grifola frondosa]